MQKTFCFSAVLALALTGCASSKAYSDSEADCDKDVSVQVIGGKLNLLPEEVQVCKNNKVTWVLVDFQHAKDIYEFRADSVTVDGPASEFPDCSLKANQRNGALDGKGKITCRDSNTIKGRFPYSIKIYWINGGEAANSDPGIWNN